MPGFRRFTAMNHALLDLIENRPQLLTEHARAYAALVASEVDTVSKALIRRAALSVSGFGLLAMSAVLAGVALMLGAALPMAAMPAPWVLLVVPLVTAGCGAACLVAARREHLANPLSRVWWQLKADYTMLREAVRP